jgi:hypothetical protein
MIFIATLRLRFENYKYKVLDRYCAHLVRTSGDNLFAVTYLLLCFIISIPFNFATYQLLFPPDGIPAGVDVSWHTYSILSILDTANPLVAYSQFPSVDQNHSNYYPSFLHALVSAISKIVAFNQPSLTSDPTFVISAEKAFMFGVSLGGTAGYALLIRSLLSKSIASRITTDSDLYLASLRYRLLHLIVSVLAFGIFIFSVTPIVQLYNDGTYAELFAMWLIFPYYLYLLVNKHWIISGILLSVIASSHNLSILMSLSATIPYLISTVIQKHKNFAKNLIRFILAFFVCAIPAIIFFYLSPVSTLLTAGVTGDTPAGLTAPYSIDPVLQQLKPGLYYGGILSIIVLSVLNYRSLSWFSGWVAIYFVVISISSLLGERFGRELSVIFGIVIGICVGQALFLSLASGRRWLKLFRTMELRNILLDSYKVVLAASVCVILIPLWYLYFHDSFQHLSSPLIVKYFTETIDKSNKVFLTSINKEHNQGVIVLFGANPWLKVTAFGKYEVLETQPSFLESSIGGASTSGGDRRINHELNEIFLKPYVESTACVLKKYDVDFVYVAMHMLPERFYSQEHIAYINHLSAFQSFSSPFLELKEEFLGENQEHLRIFSVNKHNVNRACEGIS